jgi:hypothetical protein
LFPFAFSRVRTRDVERLVLHKVKIGISTAGLSTASETLAAMYNQLGVFGT